MGLENFALLDDELVAFGGSHEAENCDDKGGNDDVGLNGHNAGTDFACSCFSKVDGACR